MKEEVIDMQTGNIETVVNKTSNSFEVTQTKLSAAGINCTQWFEEKEFLKRFILKIIL